MSLSKPAFFIIRDLASNMDKLEIYTPSEQKEVSPSKRYFNTPKNMSLHNKEPTASTTYKDSMFTPQSKGKATC